MAGEVRARDVRVRLRGRVDDAVIKVLEELAEQQHNLGKNQGEIVMLVDQMADITSQYVQVAENMKKAIQEKDTANEEEDMLKHAEKKHDS